MKFRSDLISGFPGAQNGVICNDEGDIVFLGEVWVIFLA